MRADVSHVTLGKAHHDVTIPEETIVHDLTVFLLELQLEGVLVVLAELKHENGFLLDHCRHTTLLHLTLIGLRSGPLDVPRLGLHCDRFVKRLGIEI
jgi:hypothetical protein